MRLPSFVFTLCLLLAVAFAPLPARADLTDASKSVLFEPVQISQLTTDDKRYLQMALAFENLYVGLLDGQWGAGSRKALTRYSYERFDTAPINDHLAELSLGMSKRIAFSGWDMDYLKTYGMSLLFPHIAYYEEPDSGSFENWHHTRSSLAIAASRTDLAGVKSHHAFGLDQPADDTPYTVRRDGTWITSTRGNNRLLYIRSDYVDSGWTTIILSAAQTDQGLLNAVAASLAPGRRAPIEHSKDGMLDRIVNLHLGIGD